MRCTGGGDPIVSRASDFTALVALNFFFFFGADIVLIIPSADGNEHAVALQFRPLSAIMQ
jgi:hypothetical protein